MSLPLEFVINRPPVSQQTRRQGLLREWQQVVQTTAKLYWPEGEPIVTGPIMVTIVYFHDERSLDIDNVPKPIIDALTELVFENDNQVTDLVCRKRHRSGNFSISSHSSVLEEGMSCGTEFVYVVVEEAPSQEMIA